MAALAWFLLSLLPALPAGAEDKCDIVPPSSGADLPTGAAAGSADVLILGAGAAGITAAKRLAEAGLDVLILEGAAHIGGRVTTVEVAGKVVEKGAHWVQGLAGNPLWDLAQKYSLTGARSDWDALSLYTDEGEAEDEDVRWDDLDAAIEKMEELSTCAQANKETDFNARVALNLAGWRSRTKIDEALVWFYHDFEYGSPPAHTSLFQTYPLLTYTDFEDGDYLVTDSRGMSYAFEQELAAAGLQSKLRLNSIVTKVHYAGDKVVVEVNEDGASKHYTADQAIMTFSVGVLEHDLVDFEPQLPAWKRKEIHKFELTRYLKVYVAFNESIAPSDMEHTIYADETRGRYGYWLNFNLAKFGGEDAAPYILTTHITGFEAERVARQPRSTTISEIREVLSGMFGKAVPEPIDLVICDWGSDPFVMGMYSNWPVGMTGEDFRRLQAPVGRLWFAGEAFHAKYNGFVHGAMLSGNDTAGLLLACRENGKDCSYPMTPPIPPSTEEASADSAPPSVVHWVLLLLALMAGRPSRWP